MPAPRIRSARKCACSVSNNACCRSASPRSATKARKACPCRRARPRGQVARAEVHRTAARALRISPRPRRCSRPAALRAGPPAAPGTGRVHPLAGRLAAAKPSTASTSMYSTLSRWRDEGLYGLACSGWWEQRMQRIQADHVGALRGHAHDQRVEVAEVADAPVARRAQAVQLHRRPPDAAAVAHGGRPVAAAGRGNDQRLAGQAFDAQR
jgi:hypothetical protein